MLQQQDWRYCQKCNALYYDGYPDKGHCQAGGAHVAQGYNFSLSYDAAETPAAQTAWRYCAKCNVMYYDGYPDKGQCVAGGGHAAQGYNFTLPHDIPSNSNAQAAWRYCQNCHAMFYDGYSTKGHCPGNALFDVHHGLLHGGHVSSGFNFVLSHDLTSPGPPQDAPLFSNTGPVWVVSLTHRQAEGVEGLLGTIAGVAAVAIPGFGDVIAAAVGGAAGIILVVDALGGDQGVDINGVAGVTGVIVTPHASGMFATLIQGARVGVAAATIVEFILAASSQIPLLASSFGVTVAAAVFAAVGGGTPLGWALAGAAGIVVNLLEPAPDPNGHGGIHADRTVVGDWERFILASIGSGDEIALLSWQGLFSAQGGGGAEVYANRPKVGPWETWTLMNNQDGTVSFRSTNGHFLTALNGGGYGSYCLADRLAIGNWERFYLENLPSGHVAIKTHDQNTYLSVQPGK